MLKSEQIAEACASIAPHPLRDDDVYLQCQKAVRPILSTQICDRVQMHAWIHDESNVSPHRRHGQLDLLDLALDDGDPIAEPVVGDDLGGLLGDRRALDPVDVPRTRLCAILCSQNSGHTLLVFKRLEYLSPPLAGGGQRREAAGSGGKQPGPQRDTGCPSRSQRRARLGP